MAESLPTSDFEEPQDRGLAPIPADLDEIIARGEDIDTSNSQEIGEYLIELDNAIASTEALTEAEVGVLTSTLEDFNSEIGNLATSNLLGAESLPLHALNAELRPVLADLLSDLTGGGEFRIDNASQFVDLVSQAKVATARMEAAEAQQVLPACASVFDLTTLDTFNNCLTSESRVILIGINDYQGGDNDLDGSVNDVGSMRESLAQVYGIPEENFIILTDAEASKENVLGTISQVAESSPDNARMLIYYAGHGIQSEQVSSGSPTDNLEGQSFIVPQDSEIPVGDQKVERSGLISGEDLFLAAQIDSGQQTLVLTDMCFGGGFHREIERQRVEQGGDVLQVSSSNEEEADEQHSMTARGLNVEPIEPVQVVHAEGLFTSYMTKSMQDHDLKLGDAVIRGDLDSPDQHSVFLGAD